MSKVLVDRELLAECVPVCVRAFGVGSPIEAKLRAILAQPAEAEGVSRAYIMDVLLMWNRRHEKPPITVGYEYGVAGAVLDMVDAALSAVTDERDRLGFALQRTEQARAGWEENAELLEKQRDAADKAADACRAECDQLRAEVEMLREDAERWRYVSLQGDDTHWLNLLRVELEDFGGNINAAVDALIDGEAPAMAAKEA